MSQVRPMIKKFFEQYENDMNVLDLDRIGSQYADTFMFADPNGTRVVEKQRFLAALPKRQEFFKTVGHQSTRVLSLDETALDDHYVLVHARFVMRFEKGSVPPVDAHLDSTFVFYIDADSPKIVFHIEHEELQQALQGRGLLPAG